MDINQTITDKIINILERGTVKNGAPWGQCSTWRCELGVGVMDGSANSSAAARVKRLAPA
jgi:antirestriction protein ArdC